MKLFKLPVKLSITIFIAVLIFASCKDYSSVQLQPIDSDLNNAKYVAVGNSLTAGEQSGSLYQEAQKFSFPALIARQMHIDDFEMPLISSPGISPSGGRIELTNLQTNETTINTDQGEPVNTGIGRPYDDLGVPGAIMADYLNQNQTLNNNPFYPIIINDGNSNTLPSVHAAVQELQPDLVTFWLGSNDILGYATSGGLKPFTNPQTFGGEFLQAMSSLKNLNSAPTVVVLNIPSVTHIPFATTVGPELQAGLAQKQLPGVVVQETFYQANPNIGASENRDPAALINRDNLSRPDSALVLLTSTSYLDFLGVSANSQAPTYNQQAVAAITGYWKNFLVSAGVISEQQAANMTTDQLEQTLTQMTIQQYSDTFGSTQAAIFAQNYPGFEFDKPFGLDPQNPFPNQFVLDANEISITKTVTGIFNNILSGQGDLHFDVHGFFQDIFNNGGYMDPESGEQFAPVIGSLFSLDGIHPSNKASAIIANQIIDQINQNMNANIPKVDLRTIPEGIPVAQSSLSK